MNELSGKITEACWFYAISKARDGRITWKTLEAGKVRDERLEPESMETDWLYAKSAMEELIEKQEILIVWYWSFPRDISDEQVERETTETVVALCESRDAGIKWKKFEAG